MACEEADVSSPVAGLDSATRQYGAVAALADVSFSLNAGEVTAARRRIGVMLQVSKVPETMTVHEHLTLFASYYPAPLARPWLLTLTSR